MYIADPFGILRGYSTFFILRFSITEYSVDEFQVIPLFHCVLFLVSVPFCVECTRAYGVRCVCFCMVRALEYCRRTCSLPFRQ